MFPLLSFTAVAIDQPPVRPESTMSTTLHFFLIRFDFLNIFFKNAPLHSACTIPRLSKFVQAILDILELAKSSLNIYFSAIDGSHQFLRMASPSLGRCGATRIESVMQISNQT